MLGRWNRQFFLPQEGWQRGGDVLEPNSCVDMPYSLSLYVFNVASGWNNHLLLGFVAQLASLKRTVEDRKPDSQDKQSLPATSFQESFCRRGHQKDTEDDSGRFGHRLLFRWPIAILIHAAVKRGLAKDHLTSCRFDATKLHLSDPADQDALSKLRAEFPRAPEVHQPPVSRLVWNLAKGVCVCVSADRLALTFCWTMMIVLWTCFLKWLLTILKQRTGWWLSGICPELFWEEGVAECFGQDSNLFHMLIPIPISIWSLVQTFEPEGQRDQQLEDLKSEFHPLWDRRAIQGRIAAGP